ncbi:MAG: Small Molecule Metabolism; Central intermediary metabolism; sugar-nucleotide biosynthesis, conversions [uncultured Acetobacteraceae bacterium]|uniref:Small Molecule Metabolism Central intermediary metabolism sugar-nucleotide biosynthesis, conversions n=1 Tax=uncultured Acetobacteraceae bacterium TaxID=169975 RepID=A0A6J4J0R5_9PROT|nr:MAG: Small Molecule Metabolism; Central intermediary metabolism; sugar-nucleotide biosynthesis, conversions [uncultured Acetobacteraceae bacterium]
MSEVDLIAPPEAYKGRNPLVLRRSEHGCCPACAGRALMPVLTFRDVPTNSCLMLDSPEEARAYPRGDIDLVFCEACGFVFNRALDPLLTEYSDRYEPTQAYSPTFQRWHRDLAGRIAGALDLRGKTVVEVGCGQGEFLHLLAGLSGCRGVGFDPCLDGRRADVVGERARDVELIGDFFSDASIEGLTADVLLSKMTLEHIPAAGRFFRLAERVAQASAPGMRLFIQIPESERIFTDLALEDVYYEHCNYFTEVSLAGLFRRHGFTVEEVTREYDGQYLTILGRYSGEADGAGEDAAGVAELRRLVERFAATWADRVEAWRAMVAERRARGGRVAIWGSGSKGVAFLSAIGGGEGVSHVVDINPHRQGRFMVGTGHPIVGPAALKDVAPTTVIVMNPIYRQEVADLLAGLGLRPELLTL